MNDQRRARRGSRGPERGSDSGEFARGASFAAAKGAGLVGLAVIVGIVLLQVVDDGTSGPVVSAGDGDAAATTTTTPSEATTTTTTVPTPARPPEEVRVLVLNSGGPSGSAGNMSTALQDIGYVNQPVPASNDDAPDRVGNAVMCRDGFESEAEALANVAGQGEEPAEVVPFRDPPPPESDQADCVVLVGSPG